MVNVFIKEKLFKDCKEEESYISHRKENETGRKYNFVEINRTSILWKESKEFLITVVLKYISQEINCNLFI